MCCAGESSHACQNCCCRPHGGTKALGHRQGAVEANAKQKGQLLELGGDVARSSSAMCVVSVVVLHAASLRIEKLSIVMTVLTLLSMRNAALNTMTASQCRSQHCQAFRASLRLCASMMEPGPYNNALPAHNNSAVKRVAWSCKL
eukprot:3707-Heterococcus_DN1.PRE.5